MTTLFGALLIALAIYAVARRVDVRLVLTLAAMALGIVAGLAALIGGATVEDSAKPVLGVLRIIIITFSDEKFFLPIGSAMGFAYVLRETECDQHLIRLLTAPLRRVRWLLLPGAIGVGFIVNIPLISQTSTAVAVGTVLVPLCRAAGMAPLVVGSALLLGASLGGELLNPGAPELLTVVDGMNEIGRKIRAQDCVAYVQRFVFWHLLAATTVFCVWHWLRNRGADAKTDAPPNHGRVNVVKAFVPFVPIVLLFLAGPPLESIVVPKHWLLVNPDNATEAKTYNSRLIGLAMFVGVATAVIVSPRQLKTSAKAFFEGAGYAYVNIVALIVAANAFGEGVKRIGFDQLLGQLVANYPSLLVPLAALLPLLFGALSGSGMAATQSLYKLFVQPSLSAGADPIEIGAVVSLGAAAGRTMSPVAAVTLMCAKLTETDPFALARRVAVPLLIGVVVVIVIACM